MIVIAIAVLVTGLFLGPCSSPVFDGLAHAGDGFGQDVGVGGEVEAHMVSTSGAVDVP
jgi:hypothetical protein